MHKDVTLQDFLGKTVFDTKTKIRYTLFEVTAPAISVWELTPDRNGHRKWFCYETLSGNPFARGELAFLDADMTAPFLLAYQLHCKSEEGRAEVMEYCLLKE